MDNPEPLNIDYPNAAPVIAKFVYPDWKSLYKLFFMFILYSIVGAMVLVFFWRDAKDWAIPTVKSLSNLVLYIITMLLTIRYAIRKSNKQSFSTFNFSFNRIPGWLVPVIIISALALIVGLERISSLIPMPEYVQKIFEKTFTKNVFSLVTAIIAAPILEEILCRGIILKGLLKNYSPRTAILISAIFFGVIHLNPWQALTGFCAGLFLGWIFYKTQSVIPGIIIHATINITASLFLFLPKHQRGLFNLLGMPYYILLCVCATLIFVGGCVIIQKKTLPTTD